MANILNSQTFTTTITTPAVILTSSPTINYVWTCTNTSTGAGSWQAGPGATTWTTVTGTSQAVSINSGYIANNASLVTFTLPSSPSVGDTYYFLGLGAGGYKIAQNASQLIHFGSSVTTTGTGGSLQTTNQYDTITIVCSAANTFSVIYAVSGGFTVV